MLPRDEKLVLRHLLHEKKEAREDLDLRGLESRHSDTKMLVEGRDSAYINAERQIGTVVTCDQFLRRCRKLIPNLNYKVFSVPPEFVVEEAHMLWRSFGYEAHIACWFYRGENQDVGTPGNFPIMFEWCLGRAIFEKLPPPKDVVEISDVEGSQTHSNDVMLPGEEIARGWRTVLIRFVRDLKWVSAESVEREFPIKKGPQRASWKVHLGLQHNDGSVII